MSSAIVARSAFNRRLANSFARRSLRPLSQQGTQVVPVHRRVLLLVLTILVHASVLARYASDTAYVPGGREYPKNLAYTHLSDALYLYPTSHLQGNRERPHYIPSS